MELSDDCIAGLARVAVKLVTEVIEMAEKMAGGQRSTMEIRGSEDCYFIPENVRLAVYYDKEVRAKLQYSAAFWHGSKTD